MIHFYYLTKSEADLKKIKYYLDTTRHIGLREIHKIMEEIYEEEKGLSAEQRIKKLREESDKFMRERGLNLKRVKPKEIKHIIA